MKRFEGLTAIVTGAAGGFGSRLSERLAAEGARLVLSDLDAGRLDALARRLAGEVAALAGDVSVEDHSRDLVSLAVSRFGALDIAVNNAGIAQTFVKLPGVSSDEARRILDIDLLGVFFALKHQIPQMETQVRAGGSPGAIVNIASVAGLGGAPKLSVYAAAKHGVVGLTKSAAAELASKGIRVNAVCPSYARTAMAADFVKLRGGNEAEAYAELTRGVPMKRLGEVDEVVEAILFAADPRNSFMTGQTIAVDGGITAL